MSVAFTKSALFYDGVYRNKNYEHEALRLHSVIQSRAPGAKTILDLGCGTCSHAIAFSRLGYQVVGIDKSHDMLRIARKKTAQIKAIKLMLGDITSLPKIGQFDVVISLFHVFSYQLLLSGVQRALRVAYKNMRPGGIIVFDCWYGPGVLADPPVSKKETGVIDGFVYQRTKTPTVDKKRHLVTVIHAAIFKKKKLKKTYNETHTLRYFFPKEVLSALQRVGFVPVLWGDDSNGFQRPTQTSWSATYVAKKPIIPVPSGKQSGG